MWSIFSFMLHTNTWLRHGIAESSLTRKITYDLTLNYFPSHVVYTDNFWVGYLLPLLQEIRVFCENTCSYQVWRIVIRLTQTVFVGYLLPTFFLVLVLVFLSYFSTIKILTRDYLYFITWYEYVCTSSNDLTISLWFDPPFPFSLEISSVF